MTATKLTPPVLRHIAAMTLLRGGAGIAVIALWPGRADVRSADAYVSRVAFS